VGDVTQRTIPNYLKTIHTLTHNNGSVSNTKIAQQLNLPQTNLTKLFNQLTQKNNNPAHHNTPLANKGLRETQKNTPPSASLKNLLTFLQNKNKNQPQTHTNNPQLTPHKHTNNNIPACNPATNCENCSKLPPNFEQIGKHNKTLTSLYELKSGKTSKISSIRGEHKIIQRLLDLGLTPGTQIKVIKTAPLGGPVEISIRGSKLALGQDIANNIFVETENTPTNEAPCPHNPKKHNPKLAFVLAGNASVGKSVIFNHLAGSSQIVGNWPGKTINHAEGALTFEEHQSKSSTCPASTPLNISHGRSSVLRTIGWFFR